MVQPTTKQPNSAEEWRAAQGKVITFPSGLTARVRPVNMAMFVRLGRVPDALVGEVVATLNDAPVDAPPRDVRAELKQSVELLDLVTELAFIEPKIGNGPDDLSIEFIPEEDKAYLMEFFEKPVRALRSFRISEKGNVQSGSDSEGNGEPTE